MAQGANAASCRIVNRRGPCRDQSAICAAPRASVRPFPLHDPGRSAAQIARSSRTPFSCAAVAVGFPSEARPASLRLGSECPQFPHSTPTLHFLRSRPQTEAGSCAAVDAIARQLPISSTLRVPQPVPAVNKSVATASPTSFSIASRIGRAPSRG
jgi:hypothetical protein